jgi:hypothetical protein
MIFRGALELALAFAVIEKEFQGGGFSFENTAKTADKFRREGLKDETVFLFDESDLRAFVDGVLAPEFSGDDKLAFGSDRGHFAFHHES